MTNKSEYRCPDCDHPLQEEQPGEKGRWSLGVYPVNDDGIGRAVPLFACKPCKVFYSERFLKEGE